MSPAIRRALIILAVFVLSLAGILLLLQVTEPIGDIADMARISEDQVRETLFATIERESPQAFLVTGRLEVSATTRVENTKIFLPGIVGLDLGTSRATVRVPGHVSYGFHAEALDPDMVQMLEDGTIEVQVPPLAVYDVSPDLSGMEIETQRGWARLGSESEKVERRALTIVESAMRAQATAHLRDSYQSRINAARALERLLTPALKGLGMEDPRFRFRIEQDLVVEPTG